MMGALVELSVNVKVVVTGPDAMVDTYTFY